MMARSDEVPQDAQQDPDGTLADAIAAHLALKKDHGADPNEVERERQSALAPARRDLDPSVDLHQTEAEPAVEPTEADVEPTVEPIDAEAEVEPEPEPEPAVASPQQGTGTIEFEWGGEADPPEPEPEPEPAGPDVLEQTPEFFEETPEYDRLWFEERPPRDFNF